MASPGCDTSLWLPDEDTEDENESDEINSEIEAELYSSLHYEESSFDKVQHFDKSDHNKSENYFRLETSFENNSSELMRDCLHPLKMKSKTSYLRSNTESNNDLFISFSVNVSSNEKKKAVVERNTVHNIPLNRLKTMKENGKPENVILQHQNKANEKIVEKSHIHSNSDKGLANVETSEQEINSSSEESVIFLESGDDIGLDLMMNISNNVSEDFLEDSDIVCLDSVGASSGSMSNEDSESEIPMEDVSLKSCRVISNDASSSVATTNEENLWHIDHEDIYSHVKKNFRYHQIRSMNVICHNCQQKGHLSKSCPNPRKLIRCYLCGGEGHIAARCANRICEKCFRFGHSGKFCCAALPKNVICSLCRMKGHKFMRCPDIWRRYHLTTSMTGIVKGKQKNHNKIKYCYNCGAKGHFGHECSKSRMQQCITPALPFIVSYKEPHKMLGFKVMSKERKTGKKQKVVCNKNEVKDYELNYQNRMLPNQNFANGQFVPLAQNFLKEQFLSHNQNFADGQFVPSNQNFVHGQFVPSNQNFVHGQFVPSNQNFVHGQFVSSNQNFVDKQLAPPEKIKKKKYLSKLLVRFDQPYIPIPTIQYSEMINQKNGQYPKKKKKCKGCKKTKKLSGANLGQVVMGCLKHKIHQACAKIDKFVSNTK